MKPYVLYLCCLLTGPTLAQPDQLTVIQRLDQSITFVHREKVFLHLDKPFYFTGETVWFKAYCVDASYHTLSDLSKVLYVEILDSEGNLTMQEKIALRSGMGSGQFLVGRDLVSGTYLIRAYTAWMKNFESDFFYHQAISIINPFVPLAKNANTIGPADPLVKFYPQGGPLIEGIHSDVLVQIQGGHREFQAETTIVDQDGNKISRLKFGENGLGRFQITPLPNKSYQLILSDSEKSINQFSLPQVKREGLNVSAQENPSDFHVKIQGHGIPNQPLVLVVHARGIPAMMDIVYLQDGSAAHTFANSHLESGISHLLLLDSLFNVLGGGTLFRPFPEQAPLAVSLERTEFGFRDPVRMTLEAIPQADQKLEVSVSVFKTSPDPQWRNEDIATSLRVTSDLGYKNTSLGEVFDADVDNESIFTTDPPYRALGNSAGHKVNYLAEINGPIIEGIAKGENISGKTLLLVFPGKDPEMFTTTIGEDGHFRFQVSPNLPTEEALFCLDQGVLEAVEILGGFASPIQTPELPPLHLGAELRAYIEEYSAHMQINTAYLDQSHIQGLISCDTTSPFAFYGDPEHQYRLDEYTRFPTMEEVFIEYIRYAPIKKMNGVRSLFLTNYYSSFFSYSNSTEFGEPAMTMIDGIPINELEFILNFDPLKVERIDLVTRRFMAGNLRLAGIINIATYAGDFGGEPIPDYLIAHPIQTCLPVKKFHSVDYRSDQSLTRTPDYRKVLLWEPNLSIQAGESKVLEFFTSDDGGAYQIEINGLSTEGIPVHVVKQFNVGHRQ